MGEGKIKFAIVKIGHYYDGTVRTDVEHEYFSLENAESELLSFVEAQKAGKSESLFMLMNLEEGTIINKFDNRPVVLEASE